MPILLLLDRRRDTCKNIKVKKGIAVCELHLTAKGNHIPYRITQCYLPHGRGDFPAFTPAEAGTRFSDPSPAEIKYSIYEHHLPCKI